ncbi:MAG TPA: PHP-associated domain-containing protein [Candidatus Limnocylindrales bacterium]
MTTRRGRADLHVHSRASDGVDGIEALLEAAIAAGLDVVAITDHERIDAAVAARDLADERGMAIEVVVGEEITTRGGHLLGLWLERRVPALRALGWSIAAIHDQGGVAVPAHPLVPYPLCAQGWTLRRLLASPDPAVHPDALEGFNPTFFGRVARRRVTAFAERHALPLIGNSDAHAAEQVATGWTEFGGRSGADLRAAIAAGSTTAHGRFHPAGSQVATFARQLRKYGGDARSTGARLLGRGEGRDLGYPAAMSRRPEDGPADEPDR